MSQLIGRTEPVPLPARPVLPRPIDPFAGSRDGRYQDDAVTVIRRTTLAPLDGDHWTAITAHFAVGTEAGRLLVLHALPADLPLDLAELIAQELFAPGWVSGADTFERVLTGVVLSSDDDPLVAWTAFYRSDLHRVDAAVRAGSGAGLAPVYARTEELLRRSGSRSLLDLGSCFGVFPLRVRAGHAGAAIETTASDVSANTCALLRRVSTQLGLPLPVLLCDAASVPLPDGCVDTVTLLHVLEHVDADHGRRMLAEAARLARRQVIVAVPLEDEADDAFGHVRTITLADLRADAHHLRSPWTHQVTEHHGGWLVLRRET